MRNNVPSLASCTGCTTNSVRVLRKLPRHVIVYDGLDTLDVKTTRCEVGCEQVINLACFEVCQGLQTLRGSVSRISDKRQN